MDDVYVRTYLEFLRDYDRALEQEELEVLDFGRGLADAPSMYRWFASTPHLWYAHRLHTGPNSESGAILEARILARENDDQIAAGFDTLPSVIDWYEKLYFDVRDWLDRHDWVAQTILGSLASRAPRSDGASIEAQRNLIYKVFAYYGGSDALSAALSGFPSGSVPAPRAGVEAWFESTNKHMEAMSALQVFQANKYNVMQLFDLCIRVLEADSDGNDEKRHTALEAAFADLISKVPWGLPLRRDAERTPLEMQFLGAFEPRADEQLLIAVGIEPPGLLQYSDRMRT